ncbi:MAG: helix-turn-helix domain-containing protein [Oscillospiraceae bacterium]
MFEYINYQEQKAFLTVSETARLLCINYGTVLRLIHSGRLPAIMIGNRYKIKASDLIDYIQKC